MPSTRTPPRRKNSPALPPAAAANPPRAAAWLTRVAFGLAVALVLTRATMLESLRDPLDVAPGSPPAPRGVGPGAALVLDLLAWLPALLVLARGALDRTFRVRFSRAHGLMATLALWAVLSTAWADDKFAAVVSGFHWLSATVFLWGVSQLVRSWRRLRLVAGACAGLLLVYAAQAFTYKYVELPELQREWSEHRDRHLSERGFEPGSYAALMFEGKILRGELIGFGASANTFAAVTVLLMVVTAGAVVQRMADGDAAGWAVVPAVGLALGVCILAWTDSKTAFATPFVAAGIFVVLAVARGWLARRAKLAYLAGVTLVALAAAAVVGHGLNHGSLVIDSMTFRWRYWLGSARVFAEHPLLGVGWDNFGLHYLAHRLPIAGEEIRDPHNFIVRFFTELGTVGGALALAWMLRLWWELTRPRLATADADADDATRPHRAIPTIAALTAGALLLSILAAVDLGFVSSGGPAGPAYVFLRVLERIVGAALVATGLAVVAARVVGAPPEVVLDDRPAPWILYGVLAGLGVFVLHNLVDFAMFEVGPMFLFALLAGSALGVRGAADASTPATAGAPGSARRRIAPLVVVAIAWLAAGATVAIPVLSAEDHAHAGDEHLRARSPVEAAGAYAAAAAAVPYNGDYAFRQSRALYGAGAPAEALRAATDAAVAANPADAGYRAARAGFEAAGPSPDAARVRADFERALALDPANVAMRRHYAQTLEQLGATADARGQYERALWFDDQLLPDDAERLPPAKRRELEDRIRQLGP
jgi:O-antigen ligase